MHLAQFISASIMFASAAAFYVKLLQIISDRLIVSDCVKMTWIDKNV